MENRFAQYKLFFYLSWIGFYVIYPTWALPIPVTSRFLVFSGLVIYISISSFLINLCLNNLSIDKPMFLNAQDRTEYTRNNIWFFIVCFVAILLHIYTISIPIPIVGDEATHIQGGLGLYVFFNDIWHKFFDFPIQYTSWAFMGLLFLTIKKIKASEFANRFNDKLSGYRSNRSAKLFLMLLIPSLFIAYFLLLRNLPHHPAIVRFPPVGKLLYLLSFFLIGIKIAAPRIVQIIFYVLTAFYLYRTINLFRDKEAGLIGASVYLFTPIVFYFADFAELACGTIFFIVLISFYFLKFLKESDDRDLLLTSYFIGIGFLYKRILFLMLFICIFYLIVNKITNKDLRLITSLKILSFSVIPIIPYLIAGKFLIWRKYEIVWSNLTSFDKAATYFLMLPSQISWIMFFLFLFSILFAFIAKRDNLTLFYGFLFFSYYLFYTADSFLIEKVDRYSLSFIPTIGVFLGQLISSICHKIKWRHSFRLVYPVLTIYLILISTIWQVPPLRAAYVTYNSMDTHYFPSESAMEWVRDNINDDDKVLVLRLPAATFYRDKYGIDRNQIIAYWYKFRAISTPDELKTYCSTNKISHIMFSFGPGDPLNMGRKVIRYLKNDRGNDFIEAAKFNLGRNYIFIYKLRGEALELPFELK